jgi:phage putative head morphogenesis protein, SPP1 gp7 family
LALSFSFDLSPEAALRFFRKKGLQTSFAWQDMWQQEHDAAFTVAKMMDIDLLRDVRVAVDEAIAKGTTLQAFRAQLEPLLLKQGWWGRAEMIDPITHEPQLVQLGSPRRLETIFRVNMQTAYVAGDQEQIEETADQAPFLMYDAVDDNKVRPQHKVWDDTVLRWDDPWWNTHRPPNGWNCRCSVIQLSQRDLNREGLQVAPKAPVVTTREYTNRRTGEVSRVPVGIDPGWAYNVGKSRLEHLRAELAEKRRAFNDD